MQLQPILRALCVGKRFNLCSRQTWKQSFTTTSTVGALNLRHENNYFSRWHKIRKYLSEKLQKVTIIRKYAQNLLSRVKRSDKSVQELWLPKSPTFSKNGYSVTVMSIVFFPHSNSILAHKRVPDPLVNMVLISFVPIVVLKTSWNEFFCALHVASNCGYILHVLCIQPGLHNIWMSKSGWKSKETRRNGSYSVFFLLDGMGTSWRFSGQRQRWCSRTKWNSQSTPFGILLYALCRELNTACTDSPPCSPRNPKPVPHFL